MARWLELVTLQAEATVRWVDSTTALDELCLSVRSAQRVGVDTEFHPEGRHIPLLMTVQVALSSDEAAIVDALALDLAPLAAALASTRVLVYAGHQDLRLLWPDGPGPPRLLDLQVAAGLAGHGYPTRMERVVERVLGISAPAGETMSDWASRPLSDAQLSYAAADACLLHRLADALEPELAAAGRLEWALEASTEPPDHPSELAWRTWRIAPQLDAAERAVLTALFRWRKATARARDQGERQILNDSMALDLARRRPRDAQQLHGNRRLASGFIRRYGAEVVQVIDAAATATSPPVSDAQRRLADVLLCWASVQEPESGMAGSLLLSEQRALALAEAGVAALSGWRSEACGRQLTELLRGECKIGVIGGTSAVVGGSWDPLRKKYSQP